MPVVNVHLVAIRNIGSKAVLGERLVRVSRPQSLFQGAVRTGSPAQGVQVQLGGCNPQTRAANIVVGTGITNEVRGIHFDNALVGRSAFAKDIFPSERRARGPLIRRRAIAVRTGRRTPSHVLSPRPVFTNQGHLVVLDVNQVALARGIALVRGNLGNRRDGVDLRRTRRRRGGRRRSLGLVFHPFVVKANHVRVERGDEHHSAVVAVCAGAQLGKCAERIVGGEINVQLARRCGTALLLVLDSEFSPKSVCAVNVLVFFFYINGIAVIRLGAQAQVVVGVDRGILVGRVCVIGFGRTATRSQYT